MTKTKTKPKKTDAKPEKPTVEKPVDTLTRVSTDKKPIVRIETYKNGYRVSGYFTDKKTGLEAYDFLHAKYLEKSKPSKQTKTETVV